MTLIKLKLFSEIQQKNKIVVMRLFKFSLISLNANQYMSAQCITYKGQMMKTISCLTQFQVIL